MHIQKKFVPVAAALTLVNLTLPGCGTSHNAQSPTPVTERPSSVQKKGDFIITGPQHFADSKRDIEFILANGYLVDFGKPNWSKAKETGYDCRYKETYTTEEKVANAKIYCDESGTFTAAMYYMELRPAFWIDKSTGMKVHGYVFENTTSGEKVFAHLKDGVPASKNPLSCRENTITVHFEIMNGKSRCVVDQIKIGVKPVAK